jgi:phosphatidylserine/phosphatidylglycerophosphate/cardiolipin synthase-like enzyme
MKDEILELKWKCALSFKLFFLAALYLFSPTTSLNTGTNYPSSFGKTHFIAGLEQYPITQQSSKNNTHGSGVYHALFSPNGNVCDTLCSLIEKEKELILVAVYTITDKKIATALINAWKRGVRVELITDYWSSRDRFSKARFLHDAGIPIFVYQPATDKNGVQNGLMHNKFVLFHSQQALWIGSFNFSLSAQRYNRESVLYAYNSPLFEQFHTEFQEIKKLSIAYTGT